MQDVSEDGSTWIDLLLAGHHELLLVPEVAAILRLDVRGVRRLLTDANTSRPLAGLKVAGVWRIPKQELRAFLVVHQNDFSRNTDLKDKGGSK